MKILQSTIIKLNPKIFLIVNFLVAGIIFSLSLNSSFPDQNDYLALAESILNGKFSSYFYLENYYPATLRSPGYPLFLASILAIFQTSLFVKYAQLFLYFFSIILSIKIIEKLSESQLSQYIFIALSTICIQIPYYSALISTESLTIFIIILNIYILLVKDIKNIFVNALTGFTFSFLVLTKPAFLFLPFLLIFLAIALKSNLKNYIFIIIFFLLGLMPFSAWNYTNHGVFKPTTIEGMATIAHMGYWNFKLPVGYKSKFDDYQSSIVSDFTNPFVFSDEEYLSNVIAFENEWNQINEELDILLSSSYRLDLAYMKEDPTIFITYPSNYIIKREELLNAAIIENIKKDPLYYLNTRAYNFFRVFFTGINVSNFTDTNSFFEKLKMIFAFAISFSVIFCGFLYSTFYIIKNLKTVSSEILILYSYIFYTAAVHVPFSVQARYTVPIHLCLLILLSIITTQKNKL